jgi:hypothetical protein
MSSGNVYGVRGQGGRRSVMACRIAKRVEHHLPARHGGCARRAHADLGIEGLYTIAAAHMVAIRPMCLNCGFENVHSRGANLEKEPTESRGNFLSLDKGKGERGNMCFLSERVPQRRVFFQRCLQQTRIWSKAHTHPANAQLGREGSFTRLRRKVVSKIGPCQHNPGPYLTTSVRVAWVPNKERNGRASHGTRAR